MLLIRQVLVVLLICLSMGASIVAAEDGLFPNFGCKIGESKSVTACSGLRVTASWDGCNARRDTERCLYNPPPGWVIVDHKVTVKSESNGSFSAQLLAGGLRFVSEEELRSEYESAIKAAGQSGDSRVQADLREKYKEHLREYAAYRTNKNTLQARVKAKAHGSCIDRKRGWIKVDVKARILCIGYLPEEGGGEPGD